MRKAEVVFKNGDRYEGELKDDQPDGKGVYNFQDGSRYTGHFEKGLFHGNGKLIDTFSDVTITGQFVTGIANGLCKVVYSDGSIYEGKMKDGYREGQGTLEFGAESPFKTYKGNFSQDEMEGEGQLMLRDGNSYRGRF